MKRIGEKAVREALENGATIREWEWFVGGGYRVIIDGEGAGYITENLFNKLFHDGTITRTERENSYSDYAKATAPEEEPTEEATEPETTAEEAAYNLEMYGEGWKGYVFTCGCASLNNYKERFCTVAHNMEEAWESAYSYFSRLTIYDLCTLEYECSEYEYVQQQKEEPEEEPEPEEAEPAEPAETEQERPTEEAPKNENGGEKMPYNYRKAMIEDIINYIRENYTGAEIAEKLETREEWEEELNDNLWIEDSVTGNASGSYTFSRLKAREYVLSNPDTLKEALVEFCTDAATVGEKFLSEDWEYFDTTIRCYLLNESICNALNDLERGSK